MILLVQLLFKLAFLTNDQRFYCYEFPHDKKSKEEKF